MNSLDSSNNLLEGGCWSSNTFLEGGCWNCPAPPLKGCVIQLEHPPRRGGVPKKVCALRDLLHCINLHRPNILLHPPPIFEILENTLTPYCYATAQIPTPYSFDIYLLYCFQYATL